MFIFSSVIKPFINLKITIFFIPPSFILHIKHTRFLWSCFTGFGFQSLPIFVNHLKKTYHLNGACCDKSRIFRVFSHSKSRVGRLIFPSSAGNRTGTIIFCYGIVDVNFIVIIVDKLSALVWIWCICPWWKPSLACFCRITVWIYLGEGWAPFSHNIKRCYHSPLNTAIVNTT